MGVKSTFGVTPQVAREILLDKIPNASEDELAAMLEVCDESEYRNYWVSDSADLEDHQITSIQEFQNDL